MAKFKIGQLNEDDLDQDYMPGRSEKTMSPEHKSRLERMADEVRAKADKIRKSDDPERDRARRSR